MKLYAKCMEKWILKKNIIKYKHMSIIDYYVLKATMLNYNMS